MMNSQTHTHTSRVPSLDSQLPLLIIHLLHTHKHIHSVCVLVCCKVPSRTSPESYQLWEFSTAHLEESVRRLQPASVSPATSVFILRSVNHIQSFSRKDSYMTDKYDLSAPVVNQPPNHYHLVLVLSELQTNVIERWYLAYLGPAVR